MIRILFYATLILAFLSCGNEKSWIVVSPDTNTTMEVVLRKNDSTTQLVYNVKFKGVDVLLESPLGLTRNDGDFTNNLTLVSQTKNKIDERYELKSGKRIKNHNNANELVLTFRNKKGNLMEFIVRSYNDGVAYRYNFPENSDKEYKIIKEHSGFMLPLNGKAWIHPYDWNSRLKPSYEQYCEAGITVGADSPYVQGWGFPMLFQYDGLWTMITEAVLDGTYCATHIHSSRDGLYKVVFAEKEEVVIEDAPEPVSTLPWSTPWRVVMVGDSLENIVESTLVQNLNPPSRIADESWIKPGRSSWSWWSAGSSVRDYKMQVNYVDFTAAMNWEYMLVDAGWQNMKNGGNIEDLIKYANSKGVGVWLWYHSGAGRTAEPLNPHNLMSFPEERRKEFARISNLGVKGIKVDFFDTDKQAVVKLYYDILKDAADYKIMVNFHGASVPRGLERTWPNLLTTEAVKGAEGAGRQSVCDKAAWHNTILPFTRNVVGSMDYTPVTFSNKIREGVEALNRTTYPHQLALSVVFESGVQNFADNYKYYESLPTAAKEFLMKVPVVWDETKLVAGYPGDYVVMARKKDDVWWIGGINGKNESRSIAFELPFIPKDKKVKMLVDGNDRSEFVEQTAQTGNEIQIVLAPNGGFAATVEL